MTEEDDQHISVEGQNILQESLLDGNPIDMSIWSKSLEEEVQVKQLKEATFFYQGDLFRHNMNQESNQTRIILI